MHLFVAGVKDETVTLFSRVDLVLDLDRDDVVCAQGVRVARRIVRCRHVVLINRVKFKQWRQDFLVKNLSVPQEILHIERSRTDHEEPLVIEKLDCALTALPHIAKYESRFDDFDRFYVFEILPYAFSVQSEQGVVDVFLRIVERWILNVNDARPEDWVLLDEGCIGGRIDIFKFYYVHRLLLSLWLLVIRVGFFTFLELLTFFGQVTLVLAVGFSWLLLFGLYPLIVDDRSERWKGFEVLVGHGLAVRYRICLAGQIIQEFETLNP